LGKPLVLTPDENLNKLKVKVLAPIKLEGANKVLKNIKNPVPQ
jgi:hypothetical protein